MSEKDAQNPASQLPKEVRGALKGVPFHPFFSNRSASTANASSTNESQEEAHEELLKRIKGFNLKPREIRDHLDRFVIQ